MPDRGSLTIKCAEIQRLKAGKWDSQQIEDMVN